MKITNISVQLINSMGSDLNVVNAARVSFHKESKEIKEGDKKLIKYLAEHNHWSPFSHAFVSFRIKAPIFVARQLVKHQVGLAWNEVSRRYVDDEPEFFFPKEYRGRPVNKKQGSSGIIDEEEIMYEWLELPVMCALEGYKLMLEDGVAPEQARMVLPQNTMTEWIWSGSLYAFARVCNLRLDDHAQQETQEVAKLISNEMGKIFPISWDVLVQKSKTISQENKELEQPSITPTQLVLFTDG